MSIESSEEPKKTAKPDDVWPTYKDGAQIGKVSLLKRLNPGQPEGKVFNAVQLDLKGTQFKAGDVCGVVPINDQAQVDRLLQALKIDPSEVVHLKDGDTTAGEFFTHKVEIARTTAAFLKMLHDRGKDGSLKLKDFEYIEKALGDKAMINGIQDNALADLIEHFHVEGLTPADFAKYRLVPRLYTASDTSVASPDAVHMTFALVQYPAKLGDKEFAKRGVCTGYMDNLKEGDNVAFFMQAKPAFRLPPELDKPLVMIGPGTGIAPFRAFAREIEATGKPHEDVLLYSGGQYKMDALFRDEFEAAHRRGVLTDEPNYAISREDKKQRVQALLERDAEMLRKLTEKGALFYICGDKKMGEDVMTRLQQIAPALDKKSQIRTDLY